MRTARRAASSTSVMTAPGRAAPGEQAVGRVAALREGLEHARVTDLVGRARELGSRHDDERQRGVEVVHGAQHGVGDGGILGSRASRTRRAA